MSELKGKYTRELASWAAGLKYNDIPSRIIEKAKLQTLSVLGAVFASYRLERGKGLGRALDKLSSGGDNRFLPTGKLAGIGEALAFNSALSMMLDYDDYTIGGHTGHSAVLAPLAMAEKYGYTGKEVLLAQVIANEAASRVGGSVIVGPLNGQMWAFIHAAGAACAAGRLLGLDAERMACALGMALSQPAYPLEPGFMEGDGKLFTASSSIFSGILAAILSSEGYKGKTDILEAPGGFCETFSYMPSYAFFNGLSERWFSDTLSYKLYPGCAYISSIMDCVTDLCRQEAIDTGGIYQVDVFASLLTIKVNEIASPYIRRETSHPVTLNFYVPYNVAVGLIDGELGPMQFDNDRIADSAVWDLAGKVQLTHDVPLTGKVLDSVSGLIDARMLLGEVTFGSMGKIAGRLGLNQMGTWLKGAKDLGGMLEEGRRAMEKMLGRNLPDEQPSAGSLEDFTMQFGSRVVITMKQKGKKIETEQLIPYGAAGRPMEETRWMVVEKFKKEAEPVIGVDATDSVIDDVFRFEELDHKELKKMLCFGKE